MRVDLFRVFRILLYLTFLVLMFVLGYNSGFIM